MGKVEFSFNDKEDFEFEVATSGIELSGRFEGTSEDEEVPDVPEEDEVKLRGEGLGFVSKSIVALGVVEIGI